MFRKKMDFTLLELLIVIAIIVILAAILLPSLQKAKELSKTICCLSNAKQTYLGVAAYSGDFNGYAPFYKPWYTTAVAAAASLPPIALSYGDQSSAHIYSKAWQMVENDYWKTTHLKCPNRNKFDEYYCYAVSEYYRKKAVQNNGTDTYLLSSYALKPCSWQNWIDVSCNDADANLLYRLGHEPGETLLMDNMKMKMFHTGKYVVLYEDGAGKAVNVKSLDMVTTAGGAADRFMQIMYKLSRNYPGAVTWE